LKQLINQENETTYTGSLTPIQHNKD